MASNRSDDESGTRTAAQFATTHWSVVLAAFRRALAIWCAGALALPAGAGMAAEARVLAETNAVKVYTVNRKVTDFPDQEDMSTPEAAYATLNRLSATGDQAFWGRLSAPRLAEKLRELSGKREVSAEAAARFLGAEILEVQLWHKTNAAVIAQTPRDLDLRLLTLVDGRWLNDGNDGASSLEGARGRVVSIRAYRQAERLRNSRPPVADPDKHLRPFVEFLRREAVDPQAFLLDALAKHRVVIMGEVHHRPRYWDFNAALVKAKEFPAKVGVIYLELPSNDQALVDQFLALPKYDPAPVVAMLQDMLWMGWPDQPMLDFFKTVWEVNQQLAKEQRLRIALVDMQRPWREINARADWREYDVDRNQLMADNVVRDLGEHEADARHALFIVGYMHAMVNLSRPGGDPMKSAGWHLREKLGEAHVFAIFPHSPVMANTGGVNGRLALGLFETAFAALNNKPIAFPLDHGPFGEQVFDASLDELTSDSYRNGFQGYLYLGPLEDEVFSPLIPGFYTDEFVQELQRRSRVMFGKGVVEAHGVKTADAKGFIEWMGQSWGQPRREWSVRSLGPLNAWQLGSDWEREAAAAKTRDLANETNAIRQAAMRLFDAIRKADYEKPGDWRSFPAPDIEYQVYTDYPAWMKWICRHFRTNPIVTVDLGEVARQTDGRAALPYQVTLRDGAKLEGVLPMKWDAHGQQWFGVEGLDWHLRKPNANR
jgi:hypothetical protein